MSRRVRSSNSGQIAPNFAVSSARLFTLQHSTDALPDATFIYLRYLKQIANLMDIEVTGHEVVESEAKGATAASNTTTTPSSSTASEQATGAAGTAGTNSGAGASTTGDNASSNATKTTKTGKAPGKNN